MLQIANKGFEIRAADGKKTLIGVYKGEDSMPKYKVRLVSGQTRVLSEQELVTYKEFFDKADIRSVRKI